MAPSAYYSTFTLNHQQWNCQVDWNTVELYYMLFNISKMVVQIYHPAVVNEAYHLFTYGLLIFASVVEVKQYIIVFTNYFPAFLNKLRIFSCVFSQSCFLYLGMFIPFFLQGTYFLIHQLVGIFKSTLYVQIDIFVLLLYHVFS